MVMLGCSQVGFCLEFWLLDWVLMGVGFVANYVNLEE